MPDSTNVQTGGTNWAGIIGAIGASTIGIVSTITNRPPPAPYPTSVLGAAVGGDFSSINGRDQTTGILMLLLAGGVLYLIFRK